MAGQVNVKSAAAVGLALVAAILGIVALTGSWSHWEIDAGFFSGDVDYGVGGAETSAGGRSDSADYDEDPDTADMGTLFLVTRILMIVGTVAAGLAALAAVPAALGLGDLSLQQTGSKAAVGLGALAVVLMIATPIYVAAAFPGTVPEGSGGGSGDSPTESFWGSTTGVSWGAGYAWYVTCVGALVSIGGAVLARMGAPMAATPMPPARPGMMG